MSGGGPGNTTQAEEPLGLELNNMLPAEVISSAHPSQSITDTAASLVLRLCVLYWLLTSHGIQGKKLGATPDLPSPLSKQSPIPWVIFVPFLPSVLSFQGPLPLP